MADWIYSLIDDITDDDRAAYDRVCQQIKLGQKLLEKLTIASKEEIAGDGRCCICHEEYFIGLYREMPMKAPCGHIFGGNCIQSWISSADEPKGCPKCRNRVLDGRTREEKIASGDYDFLPGHAVRQPLSGPALTRDAEQWALKAEILWQQLCEDLVYLLGNDNGVRRWVYCCRFPALQVVGFGTVDRFAREREQADSDILKPIYTRRFPESYYILCAHLDAIDGHIGTFLTPGEDHFIWLAHQHRKLTEDYERFRESFRPRDA